MADTKTDRLQQIVDEYAAALGMPAGRVEWSCPANYSGFRPKDLDLVMFDDLPVRFDADRVDARVPTLADIVRAALAAALFGWLP